MSSLERKLFQVFIKSDAQHVIMANSSTNQFCFVAGGLTLNLCQFPPLSSEGIINKGPGTIKFASTWKGVTK